MENMNHTPGPWGGFRPESGAALIITATDGKRLATVEDGPEAEVDARLIAAAPDLLSSLRALAHLADVMNNRQHAGLKNTPTQWAMLYQLTSEAQAVIAKAGGESPA